MIDIKFIRENSDQVKKACRDKRMVCDVDKILELDQQIKDLRSKIEDLRRERRLMADERNVERGKMVKQEIDEVESKLKKAEKEFNELMLLVPNIPDPSAPIGKDEKDNKIMAKWGKIPTFGFQLKNHIELGKALDIIDFERGVKVSGFRGYYLKNEGAVLHLALLWWTFQKLIGKGFTPFIPPTLLREFALIGSGHFPFGKEEIYQVANPGKLADGKDIAEPIYLAGTSEPALLAYRANEVLDEEELPLKYCGFSPCYRSEVGSYGKDAGGIYRIHEFMKVEQVVICKDNLKESNGWLEKMRKISEEILQELELPYQVIEMCTGDMGAGKYKMYDIETWMPSRENYGETHSDSNLTDWQTRRLNIKYKNKDGEKRYPHGLNNTAIASPRILIALLENHQRVDGSVVIPRPLHKWCGFDKIKSKSKMQKPK